MQDTGELAVKRSLGIQRAPCMQAPTTVTDMETLLDATNQMETDDGQSLEAVLATYQGLADYRACVADFASKDAGDRRREDRKRKEQEGEGPGHHAWSSCERKTLS